MIPISAEVLLSLYGAHNQWAWPAVWTGYALCVLTLILALRPFPSSSRIIAAILAAFWFWAGAVFQIGIFAPLNWGAWIFGVFFIVEGLLLLWLGTLRGTLDIHFRPDLRGSLGLVLLAFALAYPAIDLAAGQPWPQVQLPGTLPAPTTLATLAFLLMARGRGVRLLPIIPLLWALTGGAAAAMLGIWQDVAMAAAVLAGAVLVFFAPATQR